MSSGANNKLAASSQLSRKSFGHLTAAGIARAQEQNPVPRRLRLCHRQTHGDGGALVQLAGDFQFAAMGLYDMFHDRQPQPSASKVARSRSIDSVSYTHL